ncbi:MAG: DciA family protein [bacterium]|nr:DciA family protein [bacterium]
MSFRSLGESLHHAPRKLAFPELLFRIKEVVGSCVPVPVSIQSLRGGTLTLAVASQLEGSEVRLRLGTVRESLKKEFPQVPIDHIQVVVRKTRMDQS